MRKRTLHEILTGKGWLADVEPALARAIIDAGRSVELRRGDSLYHPGDHPGGMYGVVEGGVVISALGRDGLPVAGHIHRRCGWFGYGSFLERQERALISSANEPSVVLHVPLSELDRLLGSSPVAWTAFGRLATRGEFLYLAILSDLLITNTDRRLAAVLLRVTGADDRQPEPNPPGDVEPEPWAGPNGVPLTQAMLAELANASPHTVARFVDKAAQAGWIAWSYGRVRILDHAALSAFASGR
ncbi:MAG: Crp/Fnr family transcriptional regulator [Hyphomonas sp.]|nr:Crp/Fnr family transcriptional regulator [Hyphomonas sp.]